MPKLSPPPDDCQCRGTITKDARFGGGFLDSGVWLEDGSENPIRYQYLQNGVKERVVFDLCPAAFHATAEGPITLTVKMVVKPDEVNPDEEGSTDFEAFTLRVVGQENVQLDPSGSLYERFALAAVRISARHFDAAQWRSARMLEESEEELEYVR